MKHFKYHSLNYLVSNYRNKKYICADFAKDNFKYIECSLWFIPMNFENKISFLLCNINTVMNDNLKV